MGRKLIRILLQVLGFALILSGGLWALQGLGIVMWPAESFMLADRTWAYNGLGTVIAGIALLWLAGKFRD